MNIDFHRISSLTNEWIIDGWVSIVMHSLLMMSQLKLT